jgi:protein-S-isoprenylcysteine O-methyltransferase Ste14
MLRIPRWIAVSLLPVEFVIGLVLAPYGVSLLSPRHGWTNGSPGPWNLLGLVLVEAGTMGVVWGVTRHVANLERSVRIEFTPKYLLKEGPYGFSRNPIYVAVLTTWLGCTFLYGSLATAVILLLVCAFFALLVVPFEERRLERRFGDRYLRYKNAVPRWLGRMRV